MEQKKRPIYFLFLTNQAENEPGKRIRRDDAIITMYINGTAQRIE